MSKIFKTTLVRPETGPEMPRDLDRTALHALLVTLRIGDKLRIERKQ